jgi:hypothetical protein
MRATSARRTIACTTRSAISPTCASAAQDASNEAHLLVEFEGHPPTLRDWMPSAQAR